METSKRKSGSLITELIFILIGFGLLFLKLWFPIPWLVILAVATFPMWFGWLFAISAFILSLLAAFLGGVLIWIFGKSK
jgi:hypothetical protein